MNLKIKRDRSWSQGLFRSCIFPLCRITEYVSFFGFNINDIFEAANFENFAGVNSCEFWTACNDL